MYRMSTDSHSIFCVLFAIVFTCNLLTTVWSVPLEEYSSLSDDEKRQLYLSKVLGMDRNIFNKQSDDGQDAVFYNRASRGSANSRRPYSTRSGGISLCLWKVCPAAPWLVSK